MERSASFLFFKLILLAVPFLLLFIAVSLRIPSIMYVQQARMQDKVEHLLIQAPEAPQVIIAGDSRAEDNVMPILFSKESGLSAVNVGSGNEVLSQTYNTLLADGQLNQKRLIIISVSPYDINDAINNQQPVDKEIYQSEPWGIQRIKDEFSYYDIIVQYHLERFKSIIRFTASDDLHMPPAVTQTKGYVAGTSVLSISQDGAPVPLDPMGWYSSIRLGDLKQQLFVQTLQNLGKTNDTVVIYIGPVASIWKTLAATSSMETNDVYFAKLIASTIAPYPNLHLINFEATNTASIIPDKDFGDYVHLNPTGGNIFTKLLADTLKQQKIIK